MISIVFSLITGFSSEIKKLSLDDISKILHIKVSLNKPSIASI